MKKLGFIAVLTLFSTSAFANSNTVYSCTTTENLPLLVTKSGDNYVFSYGKLTFKNPIKQALKNPLSEIAGGSQFTTVTLELRHQGHSYVVGHIEANGNPKSVDEAGLSIDDKSILCNPAKPVIHNFDRKQMRKAGLAG